MVLMRAALPRKFGLLAKLFLVGSLCTASSGCATIMGTATGAFTGLVDGPAAVAAANEEAFRDHPEYWVLDVLVVAPLSAVVGPLAGFIKGVAIDVQWVRDELDYGEAFGTYRAPSIWRPWTLHWRHRGSALAVSNAAGGPSN